MAITTAAPPDRSSAGAGGPVTADFIAIEDVSLLYAGTDGVPVQALAGIRGSIGENQFVSIIGPSGCGKSTLLRVIGGLLPPSQGRVTVAGREVGELRRSHQIGNMFQDSVLLPWKTVEQNIRFLCEVSGRRVRDDEVRALADMAGIGGFLRKYPYELSGGMRQRVALCRALALDPVLLLMDEPFGALDEITREKMNLELLRIWQERRKTVVFVTHSISEAAFLSDRVIVMGTRPGRIVADVTVDLPRPRHGEMRYSDEMAALVRSLHHTLVSAEVAAQ